jgi:transcriptional regulator with XRE-family HTH domain
MRFDDLRHALTCATSCAAKANERWKVDGADVMGEALAVVVELAELLDVTPETVSRWENGRQAIERRAVAQR